MRRWVMRELKIFSGRANQDLTAKICRHLHLEPAAITLGKFPDGENYCKLDEDVRGRDVFLVQPTSPPVNDNLFELLIMIDCCKRASAERITAVDSVLTATLAKTAKTRAACRSRPNWPPT